MSDDRQNGGNYSTMWGPMAPMVGPWFQLMRAWTDNMSPFMPGGNGMTADWMNQFMPMMAMFGAGSAARAKVSVRVSSQNPVEVTAHIDSVAEGVRLTAEPLKHSSGHGPSLNGIRIEHRSGHVQVRLTVPHDQAGGRYTGAVHDESGNRRGEITVEIDAPPGAAAKSSAHKRARTSPRKSARAGKK